LKILSVVVHPVYKTRWKQAKALGTFVSCRLAAFSPGLLRPQEREKVAGRPDEGRGEKNRTCGEGARRADEGEGRSANQGLSNRRNITRDPFFIRVHLCSSVVKKFVQIRAIRVKVPLPSAFRQLGFRPSWMNKSAFRVSA